MATALSNVTFSNATLPLNTMSCASQVDLVASSVPTATVAFLMTSFAPLQLIWLKFEFSLLKITLLPLPIMVMVLVFSPPFRVVSVLSASTMSTFSQPALILSTEVEALSVNHAKVVPTSMVTHITSARMLASRDRLVVFFSS